jgi:hypothetical protein
MSGCLRWGGSVLAIGDESERDAGSVEQLGHAGGRGGFPYLAGDGFLQILAGRVDDYEKLRGSVSVRGTGRSAAQRSAQDEVRPEGFAEVRLICFEAGGDGLALGDEVGRSFEEVFQNVADPRGVDVK